MRLSIGAAMAGLAPVVCVFGQLGAAHGADFGGPPWPGYGYQPAKPQRVSPVSRNLPNHGDYWSGVYLGGTLGYGGNTLSRQGSGGNVALDNRSVLYGAYLGANWRRDKIVYGIEGELRGGNMSSNGRAAGGAVSTELQGTGTVRGRLGYLIAPAIMAYGLVGITAADLDIGGGITGGGKFNEIFWGAQFGLGAELKLTPQWSLRVDYTYSDFEKKQVGAPGYTNSYDPSFHAIQTGITYRF